MFTLVRKHNGRRSDRRQPPSSPPDNGQPHAPPPYVPSDNGYDIRDRSQTTLRSHSSQSIYSPRDADLGAALQRTSTHGSKMSGKAAALLGMHDAAPPMPSSTPPPSERAAKAWFKRPAHKVKPMASQDSLRSASIKDAPSAPIGTTSDKPRLAISKPTNFQHLAHTRPHHFTEMTSKSANDLLADFFAVRAGQTTHKDLQGIKASSIRLEVADSARSSIDESMPSAGLSSNHAGLSRDSRNSSHTSLSNADAQSETLPVEPSMRQSNMALRPASVKSASTFSRNSFNGFDKESRYEVPQDGQYVDPATGVVHDVWTDDRSINLRSDQHEDFAGFHAISTAGDPMTHPVPSRPYATGGLSVVTEEGETPPTSPGPTISPFRFFPKPPARMPPVPVAAKPWAPPRQSSLPSWAQSINRSPSTAHIDEEEVPSREGLITLWSPLTPAGQSGTGRPSPADEPSNVRRFPNAKVRMSGCASPASDERDLTATHAQPAGPFELVKGARDSDSDHDTASLEDDDENSSDLEDWLAQEFAGHNIRYQPSISRRSTQMTISTASSTSPRKSTFSQSASAPPSPPTPPYTRPDLFLRHPPTDPLPALPPCAKQFIAGPATADTPTWSPPSASKPSHQRNPSTLRSTRPSVSKTVSFSRSTEQLKPAPLAPQKQPLPEPTTYTPNTNNTFTARRHPASPIVKPQAFSPELSPASSFPASFSPVSAASCGSFADMTAMGSHRPTLADELGQRGYGSSDFY